MTQSRVTKPTRSRALPEPVNLALYRPPTPIDFNVPYGISARDYFNRSYNLFPEGAKNRAVLIYCVVELRHAIERTLFEYLHVVSKTKSGRKRQKLYAANDLKSAILQDEPDFLMKLRFMNLVYEAHDIPHRHRIPDLDLLSTYYGRLNDHLHLPKFSNARNSMAVWESLYKLIEEIHDKLWAFVADARLETHFDDVALSLLEDLKTNRKTSAEIVTALRRKAGKKDYTVSTVLRHFTDNA